MKIKKNMGITDRVIRLIIAGVIVVLYLADILSGAWGIGALILVTVFVLTSVVSFCPLYSPLGISTCDKDAK